MCLCVERGLLRTLHGSCTGDGEFILQGGDARGCSRQTGPRGHPTWGTCTRCPLRCAFSCDSAASFPSHALHHSPSPALLTPIAAGMSIVRSDAHMLQMCLMASSDAGHV